MSFNPSKFHSNNKIIVNHRLTESEWVEGYFDKGYDRYEQILSYDASSEDNPPYIKFVHLLNNGNDSLDEFLTSINISDRLSHQILVALASSYVRNPNISDETAKFVLDKLYEKNKDIFVDIKQRLSYLKVVNSSRYNSFIKLTKRNGPLWIVIFILFVLVMAIYLFCDVELNIPSVALIILLIILYLWFR